MVVMEVNGCVVASGIRLWFLRGFWRVADVGMLVVVFGW